MFSVEPRTRTAFGCDSGAGSGRGASGAGGEAAITSIISKSKVEPVQIINVRGENGEVLHGVEFKLVVGDTAISVLIFPPGRAEARPHGTKDFDTQLIVPADELKMVAEGILELSKGGPTTAGQVEAAQSAVIERARALLTSNEGVVVGHHLFYTEFSLSDGEPGVKQQNFRLFSTTDLKSFPLVCTKDSL